MVGRKGKRKQLPASEQPLKKKALKASNGRGGSTHRGRKSRRGRKAPSPPPLPGIAQHAEEEEEERGQREPSTSCSSSDSDVLGSSDHEDGGCEERKGVGERRAKSTKQGESKMVEAGGPGRHSFANLVAGKLEDSTLKALFRGLPKKRKLEQRRLLTQLQAAQPQWLLLLRSQFSLVLYGLGSKKDMLQDFAHSVLVDHGAVVTINGYIPSVTAYKVVSKAVSALSGRAARLCGNTGKEMIDYLNKEAAHDRSRCCFVVVHNIDGPGLKAESEQALLADLARCPSIHLLASIDHVNAPLLWSKAMDAKFRWLWIDATTYAPYIVETLDKPSILAGTFQRARQRGANVVLRSMVPNAREVFALIVSHQLGDPDSEGLDFKLWFRMCRERFLLASEAALKSHIIELTDHKMLATRQSREGFGEVMYVPMDAAGLNKMAEDMDAMKAEAEAS